MAVVVRGTEDLLNKLESLTRVAAAEALMQSLVNNVEPTRQLASEKAPIRTGRLRMHEIVKSVPPLSSRFIAVVRVGPDMSAFYGLFDEIGTAHMRAQPFLNPAFEATYESVYDHVAEDFKRAIEAICT